MTGKELGNIAHDDSEFVSRQIAWNSIGKEPDEWPDDIQDIIDGKRKPHVPPMKFSEEENERGRRESAERMARTKVDPWWMQTGSIDTPRLP
jgi:hypothetical protein